MPSPRHIAAWPLAALASLWVLFWWPVLGGDQVLFVRDLNLFAAPGKHYLMQRIADGGFPSWTPYLSTGMPFFADVSNQALYPLNAVFALAGTGQQGLSWFVALHSLLAFAAFFVLARALELSRPAAAWAGAVFGLSGYVLSMSDNINYLPAVAWAPLGLAAALHGFRGRHAVGCAGIAACVALLVLAGDALNAVLLLGAIGVLALQAATGAAPQLRLRSALLLPASAALLAVLLSAVQVLPTLELSALSVRRAGLAFEDLATWSFPPRRVLEFLHPFFFGNHYPAGEFLAGTLYPSRGEAWANSVYLGPVALALAVVALRWQWRRAWPWALLAALALAASFGQHLPSFAAIVEVTPFFATQRFPEKLVFWVTLCLCVLAAQGAHTAWAQREAWSAALARWPLAGRIAVTVLVPVLAFQLSLDLPAGMWIGDLARSQTVFWHARGVGDAGHVQVLLLHLALVLAVPLLMPWLKPRWQAPALGVVLLFAVADLAWVHRAQVLRAPAALFDTPPAAALVAALDAPGGGAPPRVYFDDRAFGARQREFASALTPRILAHYDSRADAATRGYRHLFLALQLRERLAPNAGVLAGVAYLNGRGSPLQPLSHHALERAGLDVDPWHLMAVSGVSHVITRARPPDPRWQQPGFEPVLTMPAVNLRLLRVTGALPRVFLADAARVTADSMDTVSTIVPRLGDTQRRLTLDAVGAPPARRFPVHPVQVLHAAPEHHVIEVDAPFPQAWVTLNESLFPGWTATVDGRPAAVHLMNERFMAVAVTQGRHRVEFRYRSTRLPAGLALTVLGVVSCLWLAARGRRRAR